MIFVASTISEHIRHQGEIIGERRRKIKGAIANLTELRDKGFISDDIYQAKVAKLRERLQNL